jgi:hypothetical protein
VAGLAGDPDREAPDPLARRLQLSPRAERRLEHQGPGDGARQPVDVLGGVPAADLLITVDQNHGRERRLGALRPQRPQRVDHLGQAGLHVVGAGAVQAAVLDADRHVVERPHRPDRVEVSEQELPPAFPLLQAGGTPQQMVPDLLPGERLHLEPELLELGGEQAEDLGLSARLGGGRLGPGQPLQQRHQLGELISGPLEGRRGDGARVHVRASLHGSQPEVGRERERGALRDPREPARRQVREQRRGCDYLVVLALR